MASEGKLSRRELLKSLLAFGGAVSAASLIPDLWCRPVVGVGVLPAHAQGSETPYPFPPGGSQLYAYTGWQQVFIVPDGVKQVAVEAYGAHGGWAGGSLGLGGYVKAKLNVTPGERLYIYVGGAGTESAGGYNGGGGCYTEIDTGAGGGGASDVRQGGDGWVDRVVVAGGGGGGGLYTGGGNGGGLTGAQGEAGTDCTGGGGGTQPSGGAGGIGSPSNLAGAYGAFGIGGAGSIFGGGGGGGYYGGGGGGSVTLFSGGGGGGGSSYPPDAVHQQGINISGLDGNGLVSISW
jgi:hypothetical protein